MTNLWKMAPLLVSLLGCPGKPQPSPPPPTTTLAPSPSPSPTIPPIETCFPQGVEWVVSASQDEEEMVWAVREAQEALGDRCGYADPSEAPQRESLRLLAAELEAHGFCASFAEPDAVFVEREDGRFEEHHAVYFGNGCWLSNPFRGIYEVQK